MTWQLVVIAGGSVLAALMIAAAVAGVVLTLRVRTAKRRAIRELITPRLSEPQQRLTAERWDDDAARRTALGVADTMPLRLSSAGRHRAAWSPDRPSDG